MKGYYVFSLFVENGERVYIKALSSLWDGNNILIDFLAIAILQKGVE